MNLLFDSHSDEIADRLADLIAALGDTADAVAHHLAEAEITGSRADTECCPIANYLRRAAPSFDVIDVHSDEIDVIDVNGRSATLPAPAAIGEFVKVFDFENAYPHLDSDAEVTR